MWDDAFRGTRWSAAVAGVGLAPRSVRLSSPFRFPHPRLLPYLFSVFPFPLMSTAGLAPAGFAPHGFSNSALPSFPVLFISFRFDAIRFGAAPSIRFDAIRLSTKENRRARDTAVENDPFFKIVLFYAYLILSRK